MSKQTTNKAGHPFDADTVTVITQPIHTIASGQDPIRVDTAVILSSRASAGSVASISAIASGGSIASIASIAGRNSFAIQASLGSVTSGASYGSTAAIATAAGIISQASFASQGSSAAGGFSRAAVASVAARVSLAGPVLINLPAQATAQPMHIVKKGASGAFKYLPNGTDTINGVAHRDNTTEHQVDFMLSDSIEWTRK